MTGSKSLRRDGVLTRAEAPAGLVRAALDIVWQRRAYLGTGASGALPEPIARTELAAQLFGDAHALDDGRRLGMVVQRAIECVVGRDGSVAGPGGSSRELWEQVGVLADRVSSTAMTLGVRVRLGSRPGERLAAYERTGAVAHLTWRDLDDGLAVEPGQTILVCENPRVVEAAADAGGADSRSERGGRAHCGGWASEVGLVCAGGRPALVVVALLDRLREAGARLLYHGDFDWPGLAIANLLVRRCGVRPWRMTAEDYFAVPAQLPLTGRRVEALWDPELAPAMARRGLAVHEEALLPGLISVDSLRT